MFLKPRSSAASPGRYEWFSTPNGSRPTASRRAQSSDNSRARTAADKPEVSRATISEFQVEAGTFFTESRRLAVRLWSGFTRGRPVYLRDVAEKMEDGPAEPDNYVLFANAAAVLDRRLARNIPR